MIPSVGPGDSMGFKNWRIVAKGLRWTCQGTESEFWFKNISCHFSLIVFTHMCFALRVCAEHWHVDEWKNKMLSKST